MPINGLVVMTPTSVAKTGTGSTATINANGSVTFSSCATLQLNGIFNSTYDNYMISTRIVGSNGNDALYLRFASGGTVTTDSNYTFQYVSALSTSVVGGRFGSQSAARVGNTDNSQRDGDTVFIFGPNLSQPTALRNVNTYGFGNAGIVNFASTHSTASSYDGIWLQSGAGTFTGLLTVFGFNQ
jgi:hypothetical protein